MSEALWLLLASALSLTGMGWIALSMEVHWGQVMHRHAQDAADQRQWLRWAGFTALPVSLLACLMADRPSMAVLVWILLLAASAITVSMVLVWRPKWLLALGRLTGPR